MGTIALSLLLAGTPALADSHKPKAQMGGDLRAITYIAKQETGTWLAGNFMGLDVKNTSGEVIGDINNLVVGRDGFLSAAVIGVGGFLGLGEKNIAVPFKALTINPGKDGERVVILNVTKEQLETAPAFDQTEPSFSEKARAMINRASETVQSATEQIQKSAEEMMKSDEAKKKEQ